LYLFSNIGRFTHAHKLNLFSLYHLFVVNFQQKWRKQREETNGDVVTKHINKKQLGGVTPTGHPVSSTADSCSILMTTFTLVSFHFPPKDKQIYQYTFPLVKSVVRTKFDTHFKLFYLYNVYVNTLLGSACTVHTNTYVDIVQ
jgi:hypothetical protein